MSAIPHYNFIRERGESTEDFRQRVLNELADDLEPGGVIRADIRSTICHVIDDSCTTLRMLVEEQGPPSVEVRQARRVH